MTKRELIDQIQAANCTAQPEFLARFSDSELEEYLNHLRQARQSRLCGDAKRYEKYFRYQSSPTAMSTSRRLGTSSTWRSWMPVLAPVTRAELPEPLQSAPAPVDEGTYVSQTTPPQVEQEEPEPAVGVFDSDVADLVEETQAMQEPQPVLAAVPATALQAHDADVDAPPFAQQVETQEQQNWLF